MGHEIDEKSPREHAALDDQRNVSGRKTRIPYAGGHRGKDEPVFRIHQSHAVGAPQSDICFLGNMKGFILKRFSLFPDLRKPCRLDHGTGNTSFSAVTDHLGHHSGGNKDDGKIHRIRDIENRRIADEPFDLFVSGVNRVDVAGISLLQVGYDEIPAFTLSG